MIIKAILEKFSARVCYKDNGYWVFGEWFGNRCCDNCMYFANYIAENRNDIKCVWIARKNTDLSGLNPRIQVIEMNKKETDKIVRNAHAVFMNQGMRDLSDNLLCVSGPKTINFWHGVPWKKIGLDGARGVSALKKKYYAIQNRLLSADYYLALSEDFSQILCSSCGANLRRIIKAGYPRNELFYDERKMEKCRKKLINHLKTQYSCEIDLSSCRIVTYMPTFRDGMCEQFSFFDIAGDERFRSCLEKQNVIVVQKAHFASKRKEGALPTNRIFVENEYPAQELLAATDVLITDYSSCFFDFLLCNRPIIHFLYDYEYYANIDRGLYYDRDKVVCGTIAENSQELIDGMEQYLKDPTKDSLLRKERLAEFLKYESAYSCAEILKCVES